MNNHINEFKQKYGLGHIPNDLIEEAITTSTYVNGKLVEEPNIRLAMIGDAYLSTFLRDNFYDKGDTAEEMNNYAEDLECDSNLANIAEESGMFDYAVSLVDGEYMDSRKTSEKTKATFFEALIGANFYHCTRCVDYSVRKVDDFIKKWVLGE